jgi:ubiquinone/menaquinone biosynthesis C-methylase UbiE
MFSAPEKNIEQLGIADNLIVADFGAGTGAYSIAAAKAMHGTGKVYAVEVQKDLLTTLQNTCNTEHIANISYIWGNCELSGGTKLSDNTCDIVIVSNVLFQAPDKKGVINEAKRVLKQGGVLLIIDWTASFNGMGPEKDQVFSELGARQLVSEFPFTFEKTISAGNFHYGLVFRKGLYQHAKVSPVHI